MTDRQPLRYRDLNIEMTGLKDDGHFKVRILGKAPDGSEMSANEAEEPQYNTEEFKPLLFKLGRRGAITEAELIQLGEKLAALILPGRVRAIYESSMNQLAKEGALGLRLRLRIEQLELAALPWEYAYVQRTPGEKVSGDFLALRREVSITRYETIGTPLDPIEGKDHLRIVAALASPLDQDELDLVADRRAIEAAIAKMNSAAPEVESVVLNNANREDLLRDLAGADIFHFAGHGIFDRGEMTADGRFIRKGKIMLMNSDKSSDPLNSETLATVLDNAGVRLVILGACNSASRDEGGAWSGIAPALVRVNTPAVVAMQFKVGDKNAAQFMTFLYTRVFGGYTIDEAVFEGRQALALQAGVEDRDWGVPVLYLRAEDGFLFPLPPESTASDSESPVVRSQRKIGTIAGQDIGIDIKEVLSGSIENSDTIDRIEKGAKTIGIKIGSVGGSGNRPPLSRGGEHTEP